MDRTANVVLTHEQSGQRSSLGPGDFIGRSEVAAFCIDDPRISEAHAMISLRDGDLKIIALRGRFRHNGKVLSEAKLAPDLRLELAHDVTLRCEQIEMPEALPGLLIDEELEVMLTGTMTLYTGGMPTLKRGYDPGGQVIFWTTGSSWRASLRGAAPTKLRVGDTFDIDGTTIHVIAIPLARAGHSRTRNTLRAPLTFALHDSHVRVSPQGDQTIIISGVPGKILASLLRRQQSASWQEIISDVWPEDASTLSALRRRFDAGLRRLRDNLHCVLPDGEDLFRLDGTGVVLLQLSPHDHVQIDDEKNLEDI